jgi:8-oxo-dGTP diphosphatase
MNKFPSCYVTTDIVALRQTKNGSQEVLLIQRKNDPFKDAWALPGGFLDQSDQNVLTGALRELKEETTIGANPTDLQLVGIFSEKGRDPRENNPEDLCRVVSVAFMLTLPENHAVPHARDDAKDLGFFPISSLPRLAFDHEEIISTALKAYKNLA